MDDIKKALHRIHRSSNLFVEKSLGDVDLTRTEVTAIRSVVFHKGLTQTSLSEHLGGVDKAAVARIVKSLEDKGYIQRISDENDRRAKLVYPTEKAYELRLGVIGAENKYYRWLFESVPPDELEKLTELLTAIGQKALSESKNGFKNTLSEEDTVL
ncbi:MAG: MarR family transcriptional regulator [Clostridia bacterium]|nr:MarR family transcriptional regulator [Clostridia bacterium]